MTAPVAVPVHERSLFRGQDVHELRLPCGDRLRVAEHGGQVLSWFAAGRERLYLSPTAVFDGRSPIRGGIPVCWPQFSGRGPLTRHGWVRQSRWRLVGAEMDDNSSRLVLNLHPSRSLPSQNAHDWLHECRLELTLSLSPGQLVASLAVFNLGPSALPFTGALHTYLALDDAHAASVSGWGRSDERSGWDSVTRTACQVEPRLGLRGEIDRILPAAPAGLTLSDGPWRLRIGQTGWADTVVWNPGPAQSVALSDMPDGDDRRMACVEAAQVLSPASVPAGGVWQGTQTLIVDDLC